MFFSSIFLPDNFDEVVDVQENILIIRIRMKKPKDILTNFKTDLKNAPER